MTCDPREFIIMFGKTHNADYARELGISVEEFYAFFSPHSATHAPIIWSFREHRIEYKAYRLNDDSVLVQRHDTRLDFYHVSIMIHEEYENKRAYITAPLPYRE